MLYAMNAKAVKHYLVLSAVVVVVAVALSLLAGIPYIYTLLGFSAWAFFGHLITSDDDMRGGWSNPDGTRPFPWVELLIKAVIFVALCIVAVAFPVVRGLGS